MAFLKSPTTRHVPISAFKQRSIADHTQQGGGEVAIFWYLASRSLLSRHHTPGADFLNRNRSPYANVIEHDGARLQQPTARPEPSSLRSAPQLHCTQHGGRCELASSGIRFSHKLCHPASYSLERPAEPQSSAPSINDIAYEKANRQHPKKAVQVRSAL